MERTVVLLAAPFRLPAVFIFPNLPSLAFLPSARTRALRPASCAGSAASCTWWGTSAAPT